MGFLSNPLEPEQAANISHAFLQGAAQQASVNATQAANDREDAQTAIAAKQAQVDAIAAAHATTIAALQKTKAASAKDIYEGNRSNLITQRTEAYNRANTAPGLIDDPSRQSAQNEVTRIDSSLQNLDQGYGKYVSTVAGADPTALPDFSFNTKTGQVPPALTQMGIKTATDLADKTADVQEKNARTAGLIGGKSEKLTEAQKNSRKAEDDFNANIGGVNTQLDLFNTEQAKYNAAVAAKDPKVSKSEMLGPAGGLLNSYRGFWNGIQQGRYDDLDPNMKQVATVVQQNVGANWNHPRAASQQLDILNRYFLNNPKASTDQKSAAKRIFDAIQTRVPQLEAATPYYNQIEAPPQ